MQLAAASGGNVRIGRRTSAAARTRADPAELAGYDLSGRTFGRHRREVRKHFGFRVCGKADGAKAGRVPGRWGGAAGTAAIASFSLPGGLFADVAPPVLKEWWDQAMIPPSHVRDHPGEQRNGQSR
jgi:hypothetical protein